MTSLNINSPGLSSDEFSPQFMVGQMSAPGEFSDFADAVCGRQLGRV